MSPETRIMLPAAVDPRRRAALAVGAAVALGVCLRIGGLRSGFFRDEASTWFYAGLPLRDLLGAVASVDSNPPGFYLVAWIVRHAFPGDPYALQILTLLASSLLPVFAYFVGKRLHSRVAGVAAAFALALSPVAIAEATDARTYAFTACLSCAAFLCLMRLAAAFSVRLAIASGIALAAAWYFHYSAIVFFLCAFPALAAGPQPWFAARRLAPAYGLAAALYLPWLPATIVQTRIGSPTIDRWASFGYDPRVLMRTFTFLLPISNTLNVQVYLRYFIFAVVVIWAIVCAKTFASARLASLFAAILASLALLALAGANGERYAMVMLVVADAVWLAMAIDIARVVAALERPTARVAFAGCAAGLIALAALSGYRANLRAALPKSGVGAFWQSARPAPGSIVVTVPDFLGPSIAFAGRSSPDVARESFLLNSCPAWMRFAGGYERAWDDPAVRSRRLAQLVRATQGREIYLVVQDGLAKVGRIDFGSGRVVEAALRERYGAISEQRFFGTLDETVRVVRFAARGRVVVPEHPATACSEIDGDAAPFSAAEFDPPLS